MDALITHVNTLASVNFFHGLASIIHMTNKTNTKQLMSSGIMKSMSFQWSEDAWQCPERGSSQTRQRLPDFDRIALLNKDLVDGSVPLGNDFVLHLHRLEDEEQESFLNFIPWGHLNLQDIPG